MPLPWIIAGGIVTVGGIIVNKFYKPDKQTDNSSIENSTILFGPQAAGKTNLANWLDKKKLSPEYSPTINKTEIGDFLDTRGGEIGVKDWETLIKDKKNIYYLFDMEKFFNKKEYAKSIYDDIVIKHISFFTEHLKEKDSMVDKNFIIIGTHLDMIDNDQVQNIINTLEQEISLDDTKITYGSLLNKEKAKELEKQITNNKYKKV